MAYAAGTTAAAASAASTRSPMSTAYEVVPAAAQFAATNSARAQVSSPRLDQVALTTDATGAASANASENTVTSCPPAASLTPRSREIAGRTPAIT
jgi:hypothetical protein